MPKNIVLYKLEGGGSKALVAGPLKKYLFCGFPKGVFNLCKEILNVKHICIGACVEESDPFKT